MSRFEHLPIYKQAYNLLVEFHKLVPSFPKKYKFEIGSKIISDLTESILIIIEVNSKINKKELIENININHVLIKQLKNELSSGLKERIEEKVTSNKELLILRGGFQINESGNLNSIFEWDLNSMTPIEVFTKLNNLINKNKK